MPIEVTGQDSTLKCELCDCLFCKAGPLGSNNCTEKGTFCNGDGKCSKIVEHNTCPSFNPKF